MTERAEILVVEDNLGDQVLFQQGVKQVSQPVSVHFVDNGVEALRFLRREGPYDDKPRPHAILLDLNMPKKDGRQVLAEIKRDPALKDIPVIVLSTSNSPDDVSNAYSLGAASYLIKPSDFHQYVDLVQDTIAFCFQMPPKPPIIPP